MRVLVAHSFYRLPGGEDRYVGQQVRLLERRHDVSLLGPRNTELRTGLATASGMAYSRAALRRVEEELARFDPDIVHLHNAYPALGPAVHLAAERRGVPLVMTVHNFRLRCPNGYMFTEGAPCRRCESGMYAHAVVHRCFPSRAQAAGYAAALWVHRFVLRLHDKVRTFITPSGFVAARLLEWGVPPDRVEVVRNFTEVRGEPGSAGSYLMYLGRLSGEKGVDVLLRAARAAGDPPLKIVGDGPVQAPLEGLARDLGLERTRFVGRVEADAVPALLRDARALVLPSVWDENAPIAALEAMALGRPLVVARTGGLPELVGSGEGFGCEPGDVDDLAATLRSVLDDDDACVRAGRRAWERAAAEFTPDRHLERLEDVYSKVAASVPT